MFHVKQLISKSANVQSSCLPDLFYARAGKVGLHRENPVLCVRSYLDQV